MATGGDVIAVDLRDIVGDKLERLARDFPGISNYLISVISGDFADFVRRQKLSGQALSVRSGETRQSVRFYKMQKGLFVVRPGAGVEGRLNYLVGYERRFRTGKLKGIKRPFMAPATSEYIQSGAVQKIADGLIEKSYARRGIVP